MQTYLFSEPFLNFKLSLPKDFCEKKKHIYIQGVSKVRSDCKLYFAESI